jgi:hypothetical protein
VAAAVAVLALAPLGTGAGAEPAQDNFVIGSGRARASLFEIVPRTGGLEIPVNFGKALVTYQGLSATATSGGVKPPSQKSADGDCGGGFQPPGGGKGPGGGPPGGLPAPPKGPGGGNGPSTSFPFVSTISVSTGDKDAAKGRQIDQGHFPPGGPVSGSLEHQEVAADDAPSGRAATTSGRVAFGPVAEAVNGRTEASAGVVDHKARQAHAATTIDRLTLLGGKIVLNDLRWEVTQRTGAGPRADGAFTVGSVLLDGKPLPAPPTSPPALPKIPGAPGSGAPTLPDPLAALNTALSPTGIALVAPHLENVDGVVDVTPMSLRFADSALGRQVLGPIVGDLQPLRDPVVGGLLAASCDFGAAVTVADVATSILAGAGGIRFDFGGVSATTEGEHYDNPLAGGPGDNGGLGGGFGGGDTGLPELPPSPAAAAESGASTIGPAAGSGDLGTGEAFGSPSGSGAALGGSPIRGTNGAGDGASGGRETALGPAAGPFGPASQHLPGHKGGRALAVALLALLTIAALAAADAFHLRRASRSIS